MGKKDLTEGFRVWVRLGSCSAGRGLQRKKPEEEKGGQGGVGTGVGTRLWKQS